MQSFSQHANDAPYQEIIPDLPSKENSLKKFFLDLGILLYKNYKIFIRNIKGSCCLLISPFFICLLIYLFQLISNEVSDIHVVNPPVLTPDNKLTKCIGDQCVSVGKFKINVKYKGLQKKPLLL